jgi:hypothetical protein
MPREVIKIDDLRIGSLLRYYQQYYLVASIKTGTHDYLLTVRSLGTDKKRNLYFYTIAVGPTDKQEVEHIEVVSY